MQEHVADFLGQEPGGIYKITAEQEREFVSLAERTAKHRYRACFHASPDSDFHNMVICSLQASYCRPHRHFLSPEFHTIIAGKNAVLFFDDEGRLTDHFIASKDGGVVSYRIDTGVWHMEIPLTEYVLDAESRKGPVDASDNIFALWSPEDNGDEVVQKFVRGCIEQAGYGDLMRQHDYPDYPIGGRQICVNSTHAATYGLSCFRKTAGSMKILVTGAGGFIGNFLVPALQKFGHNVTALVHRKESVPQGHENTYVIKDLSHPVELTSKYDAVIHAAGIGRERECSFLEFKHGNIDTMENLLRWIKQGHARRIINLSSISVYGTVKTDCVDEMTPIVDPGAYGLCKLAAEHLLAETSGIEHISLRMPGVFGRHADHSWLAKVVSKCLAGEQIDIFSPEFINNNYLYLPDLAGFINDLLQKDWPYQELVLGMQQGVSIREAVESVRQAVASTSEIRVVETKQKPFRINIERAESIGYSTHSFQSMIDECLSREGWRD